MKISFLIALYIDSEDRISNLDISVDNLKYHFPDHEIILSEMDKVSKIKNRYSNVKHVFTESDKFFNKQKCYNIGYNNSENDIICLYDADVVLKQRTIQRTIQIFENDESDVIYPYNGYFYDVPKNLHDTIYKNKGLEEISVEDCKLLSDRSVGGVVFFKKEVFEEGGRGNENFIGAGYEDNEIFERYKKLEYRISRINSPLFHLTHQRKETSFDHNPYDTHNKKEFFRICNMDKSKLLEEIKTWNYEV
jgi:predicted glycosyltransferase involved in capsule biosynthesis